MVPLSRKWKIKLAVVVLLTALIGGAMLATGSGEPEPGASRPGHGSVR